VADGRSSFVFISHRSMYLDIYCVRYYWTVRWKYKRVLCGKQQLVWNWN